LRYDQIVLRAAGYRNRRFGVKLKKGLIMRNVGFVFTVSIALFAGGASFCAAAINDTINGTVVDSASNAAMDSVTVGSEGISTLTNTNGAFKLVIPTTGVNRMQRQNQGPSVAWNPRQSFFSWSENSSPLSVTIQNLSGRIVARNGFANQATGHAFSIAGLPQGVYVASIGWQTKNDVYKIGSSAIVSHLSGTGSLAKTLATSKSHVVSFTKTGYKSDTITVTANTSSATAITAKLSKSAALITMFDGTSLSNWTYGSNTSLQIQDSAIQMTGCWCMTWSKQTYDNFRLFVTCRVVNTDYTTNPGQEHMGIGIWGAPPPANNFVPAACLEITPQNCWLWDYVVNNGPNTDQTCLQPNSGGTTGWNNWKTTEILVNLKNGTVKTAVDGIAMTNYKAAKPSQWQKGPIGLQDHGSNPVEYKNIRIEANPTDTNLTSVIK
jgi:hypothetical protein